MKNMVPVVDCPNSVCIKAVITEAPAKRDVCGRIFLLIVYPNVHLTWIPFLFNHFN
ncbi:unnamed protein product [Angiostrongylus costaricensis]|uniref:Transmembrane protein n=1 Tax=Angiostrongylus costaricensis TaxID=334426 RepID=A0A0R3PH83_ANGCS|nr:unnamed protein product [Angiostrongylus costaricensis]